MSRSYKKPYVKDGYGSRWKRDAKRCHNRKLRRKLKNPSYGIADGGAHKRGHGLDPWDICDWVFYIEKPKDDRIIYHRWGLDPIVETYEEQLKEYKKATRK